MDGIKFNNKRQSLHKQLVDEIRQCALGQAPGTRLPSENTLAGSLGIARMTVNRAMNELVREGIIYRERGRGTFAAGNDDPTIYLILSGENSSLDREIMNALRDGCREKGIRLEIISQTVSGKRVTDIDMTVLRRLPFRSRVILAGNWFRHIIDFFQQRQCRVVVFNYRNEYYFVDSARFGWSSVEIDLTGIIAETLHALQQKGCRRVAMLQSNKCYFGSFSYSFRKALQQCGLEFIPELLLTSYRDVNDAFNTMDMALQIRHNFPFDAFIASTSPLLEGALQALEYHKIKVPEEVRAAVLCGPEEAGLHHFPLITALQPFRECGLKIVEILADAEQKQAHHVLDSTLIQYLM